MSKIGTEMAYAGNVASAAAAGQGYGTAGLISGFTVGSGPSGVGAAPPGTRGYNAAAWNAAVSNAATDTAPPPSVQQQMQTYLSTVQSFTKDLHTLTKDHLSKGLISQLVAAGPTQGDALAQSILGGTGGAGAANKLWAQIGTASKGLGAQAAMSMYGGIISPNLKSASVTNNNISVNVSVPGGSGGSLNLTTAQINALAHRSRRSCSSRPSATTRPGSSSPARDRRRSVKFDPEPLRVVCNSCGDDRRDVGLPASRLGREVRLLPARRMTTWASAAGPSRSTPPRT